MLENDKAKRRRSRFIEQTEKIDVFGEPMPGFNLNGRDAVTSQVGVFASIIMICLVLVFMTVKFMVLAQRKAPLITNATIPSYYDNSLEWSWAENGYRMAFGI